jgi:tetratricopeptide (TPR) repeat protein
VNERKPRRPSDGIERAPRGGDSARRTRRDGSQSRQASGGRSAGTGATGRGSKQTRGARDDRRGASAGRGTRRSQGDDRGRSGPKRDDDDRRTGPRKSTGRGRDASTRREGGRDKRTSRNSDERNPTRSGIDYPSPKYRAKHDAADASGARERPALRKVRRAATGKGAAKGKGKSAAEQAPRSKKSKPAPPAPRRRRARRTEAGEELGRLADRGTRHAQADLARAAEAFQAGRERDAARLLRPLRDQYPDASAVRELLGLSQYRLGQYAAASKELEAFVELTGSVEQHPVLMDCARALGRHARVEELWEELAASSPSAALVSEGRIVLAGSRADQGRLHEAIATLDRRRGTPGRVQEHHVRVWYALADLYERAGEIPKARELFLRVRRHDAAFADVAERLAALN